uniref:Uncharacterized protein n=1 Tax=Lactuca sativa TaxID=4236 RepID=A0A9R1UY37_LACSA|nr:hypothetical protein LSAT_V11C700352310 [Lactuca sativa]
MACKKKEGDFIQAYYNRFNLATLSIPGHEELLVIVAFAQGLLPGPLSRKIQDTVPKSRDELKYKTFETFLLHIPSVHQTRPEEPQVGSTQHRKKPHNGWRGKNTNTVNTTRAKHTTPENVRYSKDNKKHETKEYVILKRDVADKKLNGDLIEIARTLQSKFKADQKDGRTRKEASKQPIKEEDIFTIARTKHRDKYQWSAKGNAIPPGDTLNISFSPSYPQVPDWDPSNHNPHELLKTMFVKDIDAARGVGGRPCHVAYSGAAVRCILCTFLHIF